MPTITPGRCPTMSAILAFILTASPALAREPASVAADIDREIDRRLAEAKVPASGQADDAEFLRRVYLDIIGQVPTREQAVAFLDGSDPAKRVKLIGQLLANARHGEHVAAIWNERINAHGSPPRSMYSAFEDWLAKQFNEARGWDKIVYEMLTATGTGPASYFVRAHLREPGQMASTTAQFFLGVQIQCAECHDHPIARWTQDDYWGLAVFFAQVRKIRGKGGNVITEEIPKGKKAPPDPTAITIPADGGNRGAGKVVKARLLDGTSPALSPKGPYRPELATWVTSPDNPYFARAAVNRLWGRFFGRGFVNPVDDFQDEVPPSHPALLEILAKEFVASGYDQKHLIRCICLSRAYQRTSKPVPENQADRHLFSRMAIKVMTPPVMYDALVTALGVRSLPGGLGSPIPFEIYSNGKTRASRVRARDEFIRFFATKDESVPATDYTHGIPQALALMNAQQFNTIPPVVEDLVKAKTPVEKAIEALFLAALTRRPTSREVELMTGYLNKRGDPAKGYAGILWILFNSSEFVLNH